MILDISLSTLLIWLACHFVGDFAFQSTWMIVEKGKSWEVNFYLNILLKSAYISFSSMYCLYLLAFNEAERKRGVTCLISKASCSAIISCCNVLVKGNWRTFTA